MDEDTFQLVSRHMSCTVQPLSEVQIAFYREQLIEPLKCLEEFQSKFKSPAIQVEIDDFKKKLDYLKEQENMLKAADQDENVIDKSAQMPFKKKIIARPALDTQGLPTKRAKSSLQNIKRAEVSPNKGKLFTGANSHNGGNEKSVKMMPFNSNIQDTTAATTSAGHRSGENIFKKPVVPSTVKAKTNCRRPAVSIPNSGPTTSAVNPLICESNAFGGIKIEKHNESTAITYDLLCRSYPTLCVNVKPYLRSINIPETSTNLEKKVKKILVLDNKIFCEFLLTEGLIKQKQMCVKHPNIEMKLGTYSDTLKFSFSGGYAWLSECCPNQFVSVFHGSIFENAMRPPQDILKLLYHWVCQSSIENIMKWVNVNCNYIQNVFTWFRSLCTLGVHTKCRKIGGARRHVEVGLIALGMQTSFGQQQKCEIVGVYDRISQKIRLCAFEPSTDDRRNHIQRFRKLLKPIGDWVHRDSIICLDSAINPAIIRHMGFQNILQTPANTDADEKCNATIMKYLRINLPEFFHNVLDSLSYQTVQQFLDELVWREWFGTCNFQAYSNITEQLIELTVKTSPSSFHPRLQQVALNPHNDWNKTFKCWSSSNLNST